MWRRVRLIPFSQTIPEEKRDPDLERKLLNEAEGVLAWAVEGAVTYLNDGLTAPQEAIQATGKYQSDQDTIGRFSDECTLQRNNATATKKQLYAAYKEWAISQGEYAITQKRFGQNLDEKAFDSYRDNKGRRCWLGFGLLDES